MALITFFDYDHFPPMWTLSVEMLQFLARKWLNEIVRIQWISQKTSWTMSMIEEITSCGVSFPVVPKGSFTLSKAKAKTKFLWFLSLLSVNIKLDWLEAMSGSDATFAFDLWKRCRFRFRYNINEP